MAQVLQIHLQQGPLPEGLWRQLKIYRNYAPNYRKPVIYPPSILIVAQGSKCGYYQQRAFPYHPRQFLVLTAPLPIECQVTRASAAEPYLAFSVPIDLEVLGQLATDLRLELPEPRLIQESIAVSSASGEFYDAALRLLTALTQQESADALGLAYLRELYYLALKSEQGKVLLSVLSGRSRARQLSEILSFIHANIDKELAVAELADMAYMSLSAFHRSFKAYTAVSPVQYIKKMRLHKAYSLMHYDGVAVAEAARRVGYRSASQFSREFKRAFGETPVSLLQKALLPTV